MNKKSKKLQKLENKRFSIYTTDLKTCFICQKMATDIHEVYGGANRQISIKNGLCIPICRSCHTMVTFDMKFAKVLKKHCQLEFEKKYSRQDFMNLVGKNYDI